MRTLLASALLCTSALADPDLLTIDNGTAEIGIDRSKGAAITHLSWKGYADNAVNSFDPGRLIQQSYYAGKKRNRQDEGQSKHWSPWNWNPIQGGGTESWARVTKADKNNNALFSETIPKLWDMADEEAEALMRQWTSFEPNMPNVIAVRCEIVCKRQPDDPWGPAKPAHQELPATYFTRNFDSIQSYLGDNHWHIEPTKPGPPWTRSKTKRVAMAAFNDQGQGIAIFSPNATLWLYGPVGKLGTANPKAPPCVHIAPVTTITLGPQSTLSYRYWLIVGSKNKITKRLEQLHAKYKDDRFTLTNPTPNP